MTHHKIASKKKPQTSSLIDPMRLSDDEFAELIKKRKAIKAKRKASTAAKRVEYRQLLENYCLGEVSREELPEDGFGFSLQDIFTAVVPRIYTNEDTGETFDTSTVGRGNPTPAWVRKMQEAEKKKAAEEARAVSEAEYETISSPEPDYSDEQQREELEEAYD